MIVSACGLACNSAPVGLPPGVRVLTVFISDCTPCVYLCHCGLCVWLNPSARPLISRPSPVLPACLSVRPSAHPSSLLSINPSVHRPIHTPDRQPVRPPARPYVYLTCRRLLSCLSVCPPVLSARPPHSTAVCPSVRPPVCPPVRLAPHRRRLPVRLSVALLTPPPSARPSSRPSRSSPRRRLPARLSVRLPHSAAVCQSVCPSVCLTRRRLPVRLSVRLPHSAAVCPTVYPSVCLTPPVCPSVCLTPPPSARAARAGDRDAPLGAWGQSAAGRRDQAQTRPRRDHGDEAGRAPGAAEHPRVRRVSHAARRQAAPPARSRAIAQTPSLLRIRCK